MSSHGSTTFSPTRRARAAAGEQMEWAAPHWALAGGRAAQTSLKNADNQLLELEATPQTTENLSPGLSQQRLLTEARAHGASRQLSGPCDTTCFGDLKSNLSTFSRDGRKRGSDARADRSNHNAHDEPRPATMLRKRAPAPPPPLPPPPPPRLTTTAKTS